MNTPKNVYKYSDQQGSYTVSFGDRVIIVKYTGFMSEQLVAKFVTDLELMLTVVEWPHWGYYGDHSDNNDKVADTPLALAKLYKRYIEKGCVVDAYTVSSPPAIDMLNKARKASGITNKLLDEQLFASQKEALDFIHSKLQVFATSNN